MNKLLYFPNISIPDSLWLKRTLLYWDEVASIVPYDHLSKPDQLDPHMAELMKNGLVKTIIPEEYVYGFNDFEKNILDYVDSVNNPEQIVPPVWCEDTVIPVSNTAFIPQSS